MGKWETRWIANMILSLLFGMKQGSANEWLSLGFGVLACVASLIFAVQSWRGNE